MTRPLLLVTTILAILAGLVAGPASPAGPNAVVGNAGCQANVLARNDDGSTGAVPIGFELNFFGNRYSQLYVNNNGNVTFGSTLGT